MIPAEFRPLSLKNHVRRAVIALMDKKIGLANMIRYALVGLGFVLMKHEKELPMVLDTLRYRRESKAWQKKYDALAPKDGDVAPDFELLDVNGENLVHLSDFQGKKPVALIFGSYT